MRVDKPGVPITHLRAQLFVRVRVKKFVEIQGENPRC
jgi:hypothetical protein